MSDFTNKLKNLTEQVTSTVVTGAKVVSETAMTQYDRLKTKNEISQYEKDIMKAYARIGEVYYNAQEKDAEMVDVSDVIELISSKKKLIAMLEDKLYQEDEAEIEEKDGE